MDFISFIFYAFAFVLIAAAGLVITVRNPVHAVLFLILAFFNAAGIFVLLGAEYLAMTLVIVYVGAVAVLFLFVVMMLDIDIAAMRQGFLRYLPVGGLVAVVFIAELFMLLSMPNPTKPAAPALPIPAADEITNTEALGMAIYLHQSLAFEIAGLILLVAMIGAIVLTLRDRPGVRRQKIADQLKRDPRKSIQLVDVKPGSGA